MKIELNLKPYKNGMYTGFRYFENGSSIVAYGASPLEVCKVLMCYQERKDEKDEQV